MNVAKHAAWYFQHQKHLAQQEHQFTEHTEEYEPPSSSTSQQQQLVQDTLELHPADFTPRVDQYSTPHDEHIPSTHDETRSDVQSESNQSNGIHSNGSDPDDEVVDSKAMYSSTVRGSVAKYFDLRDESNDTFQTEFVAGLSGLNTATNETTSVLPYTREEVLALQSSTAIASGIATILMGLFSNLPLLASTGVNYSSSFHRISAQLGHWELGLGLNVIVGAMLLGIALVLRPFRITKALPEDFRLGLGAGIGLSLANVALKSSGALSSINEESGMDSTALVAVSVLVVSISVISSVQMHGQSVAKWAYLFGIITSLVLHKSIEYISNPKPVHLPPNVYPTNLLFRIRFPTSSTCYPDQSNSVDDANLTTMSISNIMSDSYDNKCGGAIARYVFLTVINKTVDTITSVITLVSAGCIGTRQYNKLKFHRALSRSKQLVHVFIADAVVNLAIAPSFGVGIITPFIESIVCVAVGARSGLASVIAGVMFLLAGLVSVPLGTLVSPEIVAPALFAACIGILRLSSSIDMECPSQFVPAFTAMALIPLTGVIGTSVAIAYILLVLTHLFGGKFRELDSQMTFSFFLAILLFVLHNEVVVQNLFLLLLVSFSLLIAGFLCAFIITSGATPRF